MIQPLQTNYKPLFYGIVHSHSGAAISHNMCRGMKRSYGTVDSGFPTFSEINTFTALFHDEADWAPGYPYSLLLRACIVNVWV